MIKVAEPSPRVCDDGTIRWYYGDTFEIEFNLSFIDDEGEKVEVSPTDEITLAIYQNKGLSAIYETKSVGSSKVTFALDEETTKKFRCGEYFYTIRRNSVYITTLMKRNRMVVE